MITDRQIRIFGRTATACLGAVLIAFLVLNYFAPYEMGQESESRTFYLLDEGVKFDVDFTEIRHYNDPFRNSLLLSHGKFMTTNDPVVTKIIGELSPYLDGKDDRGKADVLRDFVQTNISYSYDHEKHGTTEWIQYPSETVLSGSGDCEDSAILLCTLYRAIGLDTILIHTGDHVFSAVNVVADGEKVSLLGKTYVTVETTYHRELGEKEHEGFFVFLDMGRTLLIEAILIIGLLMVFISYCDRTWHDESKPKKAKTTGEIGNEC